MNDQTFILLTALSLIIPGVILAALGAVLNKAELYGFAGTLLAGGAGVYATRNRTYASPEHIKRAKIAGDVVVEAKKHAEEIKTEAAVKAEALEAAAAAAEKAATEEKKP